jgi:tRNA pseudouridine32 synthase/23S rRNA pseudouridine746 synthase
MTPEELHARLLYRDGLMLVMDKPAGLPVHQGPKGGAAVDAYFDALRFGLPRDPALAHRLDKDTSGCLVLGRHRKALAALGKLFKEGKVGKLYWAVVEGGPEADEGRIDMPLSKLDATRGWWMKPDPHGLPSATLWKVMGRGTAPQSLFTSPWRGEVDRAERDRVGVISSASPLTPPRPPSTGDPPPPGEGGSRVTWLALQPLTGRTHQLRVHCAEMDWPIVGDRIYGSAPRQGGPPLHLHAREVTVPISKNKPPVTVTAPVPAHMRELLKVCGWTDEN